MKKGYLEIFLFPLLASCVIFGLGLSVDQNDSQQQAETIVKHNCSVMGCHQGKFPAANLNMELGQFPGTVVDVPSKEKSELKIVDKGNPEKSYLFLKVQGSPEIKGKRMPLGKDPLTAEEIQAIANWILSLK